MKKWVKISIGVILVPVLLIAAVIGYYSWTNARDRAQRDEVTMSIRHDTDACSEEFPLLVTTRNGSDRIVNSINFDIEVHRKGYSDDLNDILLGYESDKIIEPGESFGGCWKYKLESRYERFDDPSNLDFEIGYKSVHFRYEGK